MLLRDRIFLFATCAPVAQLDRVLVSEAKGRRFESSRAREYLTVIDLLSEKFVHILLAGLLYQYCTKLLCNALR